MPLVTTVLCESWLHRVSLRAFTGCFLVVLLSVAGQLARAQTTYYVAATGNDANDGRSMGSPFQSLAKVNTLTLRAGDAVLLRRGDTFRGTLSINQSGSAGNPIVVDAYGSGNKPVIAGSVPVSGWSRTGNVWQASCPACGDQVTGVYRNGAALPLGRYPNLSDANRGYLTVQSHSGKNQLTSQQGLSANWTGGEVVVRPTLWIMQRAPITGQNGNTLSLNNGSSNYELADGWGFFIQNHPATLDQPGEWYYNPASKTIQLYDPQSDPNTQLVTATAFNAGVTLNTSSSVTVRNVQVTQTITTGLYANGGSNLSFTGNDITNSGLNGVYIAGSGSTVLAENNLIEDVNNIGFEIEGYQNVTVRGNTVRRAGLVPGRGQSGDGGYTGVQTLSTANTLIENNVIDQVGYVGISFTTNTTVRTNQVANFCQVKSDGGGIYISNGTRSNITNVHILSNIVSNGIGTPEGAPPIAHIGANGIFIDDCTQNVEVANNTTFGNRGIGIFLRGASTITLTGNTSFNNNEEQLLLAYNNSCDVRNNTIQNNIFLGLRTDLAVTAYESSANDLNQYGQFDANYYLRPFEDQFKIRAVYRPDPNQNQTGGILTLAEWQSRWNQDRNSFNSPVTYKSQVVTQTGATLLDQSFSSNTNGWNGYSPYGNGRIDWDNTNKLDGGSMRLSFASASGRSDSYLLAFINIGAVTKGKTYQLLFDGVASGAGKRVQIYPRRLSGNYQDLADRASLVLGTGRQTYEATFTATDDESNAILLIQVLEDGQTAWVDNLRLREATLSTVNPEDKVKLYYNTTFQDKVQPLDGTYRDARNNVYSGQVVIAPFSSLVLLKENNTTPTPTPTTLREPENPANALSGLNYQYYEGSWSTLPDFNALTPLKTGTLPAPTLAVRNRDLNYGLRFTGFVSVPADGVYTFYSSSDDGSKLFIGTTEVVDNDGGHPDRERSGTIGLKAGLHALTVVFFQGVGDQALTLSYSGPNLGKQTIPAAAYRRVDNGGGTPTPTAGTGTGLRADYFNNTSLTAPVIVSRIDATVDFDWGNGSPASGVNPDNFSVRWTGQVEAPVSGNYTFSTLGDDGVRLWVNGVQLIEDWNGHPPKLNTGPVIALTGGQKYEIRMEYFDSIGGAVARLLWAYPGQDQQVVPKTRLYPAASSSGGRAAAVGTGESSADMIVFPIPAREEIRVRYYAAETGAVTLQLTTLTGQPGIEAIHNVTAGENLIRVPVRELTRGLYILTLTQGQQRTTRKVILTEQE